MKNQNLFKRFIFAVEGLRSAWKSEKSFRSQILMTFLVLCSLIYLKPSPLWLAIFILIVGATLAAELINTALEFSLDLLHPDYSLEIKKAKDCAAAAVLVLSISSILIFAFFIYEKLF